MKPLLLLVVLPLLLLYGVLPATGLDTAWRPLVGLWPTVFLALWARDRGAAIYPLGLGLARDLMTLQPLFTSAVAYVFIFRLVREQRRHLYRESPSTQASIVFAAAVVATGLDVLALYLSTSTLPPLGSVPPILVALLLTAALAPVLFAAAHQYLAHLETPRNTSGDYPL